MFPSILPNWHPILVHFTIGLFGASILFYLLSLPRSDHRRTFRMAGRLNLWFGLLFTTGTLLTGWYAYNTVPHDAASHEVMTTHRNLALLTAAAFAALTMWSFWFAIHRRRESGVFVLLLCLAGAPLAVTGFYGGELVYRHGVGVLSLPDPDDHHHGDAGHDHHGDGSPEDAHTHAGDEAHDDASPSEDADDHRHDQN